MSLVLALAVVGLLAAVLRWTFGSGSTDPSPPVGTGYGLLTEVALVPTVEVAELLRARLADSRVRATVAPGEDGGFRVLVFPADETAALLVLRAR